MSLVSDKEFNSDMKCSIFPPHFQVVGFNQNLV